MTKFKMIFRWKVVIKKSFKIWVSRADTSVNHYNWNFTIEFSDFDFKRELGILRAWTSTLRLNRRTRLLPYELNLRLFFHKVKYG